MQQKPKSHKDVEFPYFGRYHCRIWSLGRIMVVFMWFSLAKNKSGIMRININYGFCAFWFTQEFISFLNYFFIHLLAYECMSLSGHAHCTANMWRSEVFMELLEFFHPSTVWVLLIKFRLSGKWCNKCLSAELWWCWRRETNSWCPSPMTELLFFFQNFWSLLSLFHWE